MDEVVVTGFGSFPGQPVNPTEAVVDAIADDPGVVARVLPVSWRRSLDELDALVAANPGTPVVAFGVAASASGVRVEQVGRRRDHVEAVDVDDEVLGDMTGGDRRVAVPTRLPVRELEEALRDAGVPVEASDDAGAYVCNHVLHHALTSLPVTTPTGFVHVPDVGGAIDLDVLVRAAHVVVDEVRRWHRDAVPAPELREVATTWWDVDVDPVVRWSRDGTRHELVDPTDPTRRLLLRVTDDASVDPRVVAEVLAEGLAACDFPPTGEEASPTRVAATLRVAGLG